MASSATTSWLAVAVALGFAWIGFFEPRIQSTDAAAAADSRVLAISADHVEKLRLHRDEWTAATITRVDGHSFRTTEPFDGAVDAAPVSKLLSDLEFAQGQDHLIGADADAAHLRTYGLDKPALVLSLGLGGDAEEELSFGAALPSGNGVYARAKDREGVWVVDGALLAEAQALLNAVSAGPPGPAETPAPDAPVPTAPTPAVPTPAVPTVRMP